MKKKLISVLLVFCLLLSVIPVQAASGLSITYYKKNYTYTNKQLKVTYNGKNISITKTPGLIMEDGVGLLPYYEVFKKALKVSSTYNSSKRTITFEHNGNKVILYINKTKALVNGAATTAPIAPRFIKFNKSNKTRIMVPSRFVAENLGFDYYYDSANATIHIEDYEKSEQDDAFEIIYDGERQSYTELQYSIYTDGKQINTDASLPGMILNDTAYIPAKATASKGNLGITYTYKNSKMTLKKDNTTVIMKANSDTMLVNGQEKEMDAPLILVKKVENKTNYVMVPGKALADAFGLTFLQNDTNGTFLLNSPVTPEEPVEETKEVRAMWVSYLEFGWEKKTEAQWKAKIDKIFDNCVIYKMDTIMFQVRPFGDAVYKSDIFPWSKYISGTQGTNPGYDPFEYAVKAAHKRGLKIEAWINPYRVASGTTDVTKLSKDNPARKFRSTKGKERYVLSYNGNLYYNPAVPEVRQLIVDGVKEILDKYDVDGIHMDDYFYPALGSSYKTNFDATEYNRSGSKLSIANWRRENVNTLVESLYKTVKTAGSDLKFGISPAGNINNLRDDTEYYVDIDTWLSKKGYVDYICPQIYWSFNHPVAAYDKMVNQWIALNKANLVDLYIGIPVYKAGDPSADSGQWANKTTILRDQILYGRKTKAVKGYAFFSYNSFQRSVAQKEVANLLKVLD